MTWTTQAVSQCGQSCLKRCLKIKTEWTCWLAGIETTEIGGGAVSWVAPF